MQLKKTLNDRSRSFEQSYYNNIQFDWYANFGKFDSVQQCAVTRKQSIVTASQA